jgi:hypothetical protein
MHVFLLDKPFSAVRTGRTIALPSPLQKPRKDHSMTRQNAPTCEDCYFRRHGLCAMTPERPCPTFRAATRTLQPPRQPRLVPLAVSTAAVA